MMSKAAWPNTIWSYRKGQDPTILLGMKKSGYTTQGDLRQREGSHPHTACKCSDCDEGGHLRIKKLASDEGVVGKREERWRVQTPNVAERIGWVAVLWLQSDPCTN